MPPQGTTEAIELVGSSDEEEAVNTDGNTEEDEDLMQTDEDETD